MHHPDSCREAPINCKVSIEGEEVVLEDGVAVVSVSIAAILERMGYLRGAEVQEE